MADTVSFTVSALSLVENLARLVKLYHRPIKAKHRSDLLGEMMIMQKVMAESVLMTQDLLSKPPESAVEALARCAELQEELASSLAKNAAMSSRFHVCVGEDSLAHVCSSYKSAVLLFQEITTNALTHDYLREVYRANVDRGDVKFSPSGQRVAKPFPGRSKSLTAPSPESQLPGVAEHNGSSNDFTAPKSRSQVTKETERKESADPSQKLSLFNATISYIADVKAETDGERLPTTNNSKCVCGVERLGIWFPVRGKFDSGADADFISEDIVKRAELEPLVRRVTPMEVKMFGVTFGFGTKIELNWQLDNDVESYTQDFWIARDANFDLIIGEPWLNEHGYNILADNRSRMGTLFFGMLKLGLKTKEQKKREDEKEASKKASARKTDAQRKADEEKKWASKSRIPTLSSRTVHATTSPPVESSSNALSSVDGKSSQGLSNAAVSDTTFSSTGNTHNTAPTSSTQSSNGKPLNAESAAVGPTSH